MHPLAPPSRSRPLRTLACALAVLTCASPLLATAHEASVQHFVCAEHGELVEAGRVQASAVRVESAGPSFNPETAAARPAQDDHCFIAAHSRHRSIDSQQRAASGRTACLPQPAVSLPAAPPPSQPLYRLAPKASPPSRA